MKKHFIFKYETISDSCIYEVGIERRGIIDFISDICIPTEFNWEHLPDKTRVKKFPINVGYHGGDFGVFPKNITEEFEFDYCELVAGNRGECYVRFSPQYTNTFYEIEVVWEINGDEIRIVNYERIEEI